MITDTWKSHPIYKSAIQPQKCSTTHMPHGVYHVRRLDLQNEWVRWRQPLLFPASGLIYWAGITHRYPQIRSPIVGPRKKTTGTTHHCSDSGTIPHWLPTSDWVVQKPQPSQVLPAGVQYAAYSGFNFDKKCSETNKWVWPQSMWVWPEFVWVWPQFIWVFVAADGPSRLKDVNTCAVESWITLASAVRVTPSQFNK